MIYLASASPRRRRLLKQMGIRFKAVPSRYHEPKIPHLGPSALARRHAREKAADVLKRLKLRRAVVLAADTLVYVPKRILGKPRDLAQAARFLGSLQGRWHTVYTGVALCWISGGKLRRRREWVEKTRVKLRRMSAKEISRYFKIVNPLDKAGAYAIQSADFNIVEAIRGSYSNAVGLPVETLSRYLL